MRQVILRFFFTGLIGRRARGFRWSFVFLVFSALLLHAKTPAPKPDVSVTLEGSLPAGWKLIDSKNWRRPGEFILFWAIGGSPAKLGDHEQASASGAVSAVAYAGRAGSAEELRTVLERRRQAEHDEAYPAYVPATFSGYPALRVLWERDSQDPDPFGGRRFPKKAYTDEYLLSLDGVPLRVRLEVGTDGWSHISQADQMPAYARLKEEGEQILQNLRIRADGGATATGCTASVRGLNPQKPGDVISPGATYYDSSGKEVGILQERWYINRKETTSVVWDGKSVTIEHQWTCLDHSGNRKKFTIAAYQAAPASGAAGAPPAAGGNEIIDSPVPGARGAGSVPGPENLPEAVIGIVLPGLIAIITSVLGGIGGGAPKPPVVPPAGTGGADPLPPAAPPVLPIPTSPASVPFPAAPPVAGGTVVLPPAGSPPSTAAPAPPPSALSPEAKKKAMDEKARKQIEDANQGWWDGIWSDAMGAGETAGGWIKSGADLGVNILAVVTGPAGQRIKSIYETGGILADHLGGAIADGKVRDHAIGAITDVASKKLTDMMKDKIFDGTKWAGGKVIDGAKSAAGKIGNALPGQISGGISSISGKISGGIDGVSNKIFGPGAGGLSDLGHGSVTTTIKSIFGTGDKSGQVRKIIWEGGKDLGTDWAKDQVSDTFIQGTTGGRIKGMDDYKQKISDIAQETMKDKLDSWGRKPKPGAPRFR